MFGVAPHMHALISILCQFARVVKGVDLRSTAGNCAWARTPQLTNAKQRSTCCGQAAAEYVARSVRGKGEALYISSERKDAAALRRAKAHIKQATARELCTVQGVDAH